MAIVVVLAFLGCTKSEPVKKNADGKSADSSLLAALKDSDVMVRVGTNEFTKADFTRLCAFRKQALNMAVSDKLKRNLNGASVQLQLLATYPSKVSVDGVIRDYAASNTIVVTQKQIDEMRSTFQRSCKKPFVSWKTFAKDFTGDARKELDAEIARMALQAAVREKHFKDSPVTVTDEETADCQKWIARYNERAAQTNAVIWANASNIWQQIVSKKITFEDAANRYNQDESEPENGEWAAFTLDGFNDEPELKRRIEAMTPGEITPPIEGDNGMMILKLVEIERQANGGEPRYVLARIFFRLPEFYETVGNEELKGEMLKTKSNKQFVKFVEGLIKAANVEIVCDKKVFEEAREALKFPTASML